MWPRLLNIGAGLWLMAAPAVHGYSGTARLNDTIVGAVAVTIAIIASSEVMRPLRFVTVALGCWLLIAPWFLGFAWIAAASRLLVAVFMVSTGLVRGRVQSRFGGGWSSVWPGRHAR